MLRANALGAQGVQGWGASKVAARIHDGLPVGRKSAGLVETKQGRSEKLRILAIDPGPTESGFVIFADGSVLSAGVLPNREALGLVYAGGYDVLAFEMIASYGMSVGKSTFETLLWAGRFVEAAGDAKKLKVYRMDCKRCLLKSHAGNDAAIRDALISRLGVIGTKKSPGPLFGIKSHAWAALAVAVTASEMLSRPEAWGELEYA